VTIACMPRPPRRPRADECPVLVARDARIVALRGLGVPVATIARLEEISRRTVYRVLARATPEAQATR
jgi:DNA invertase Pin-like site-specific DNA recombinase